MADGLGMTDPEWVDLRNQVDDSFWVMRAIGLSPFHGTIHSSTTLQATLRYLLTTTASLVALTS